MNNGVCWVTWGKKQPDLLLRSVKSVKKTGLSTCLISSAPVQDKNYFDYIVPFQPEYSDCRCRVAALQELSPFDISLHLDTDTVLCHDVSFGFTMAERHGIACCIAPANDATTWHHLELYPKGMVQYNAGVLFYSKMAHKIFYEWLELNKEDAGIYKGQDQPGLAMALYKLRFNPFVLPHTWNFRPDFGHITGFGPVYIWHSPKPTPNGLGGLDGFWKLRGMKDCESR